MTVLAAVCTKMPEAKLGIILLPMVSFTAGNVSDVAGVPVYEHVKQSNGNNIPFIFTEGNRRPIKSVCE